jgi:hypothetical protein
MGGMALAALELQATAKDKAGDRQVRIHRVIVDHAV